MIPEMTLIDWTGTAYELREVTFEGTHILAESCRKKDTHTWQGATAFRLDTIRDFYRPESLFA